MKFREETKWARLADASFGDDVNANATSGESEDASAVADAGAPHTSVLFTTKFTNNTKEPQEYTMKTEKTTQSSFMIARESGYTRG